MYTEHIEENISHCVKLNAIYFICLVYFDVGKKEIKIGKLALQYVLLQFLTVEVRYMLQFKNVYQFHFYFISNLNITNIDSCI